MVQNVAIIVLYALVACVLVVTTFLISRLFSEKEEKIVTLANDLLELHDKIHEIRAEVKEALKDTGRDSIRGMYTELEEIRHEVRKVADDLKLIDVKYDKLSAREAQRARDEKRRAKREERREEPEEEEEIQEELIPPEVEAHYQRVNGARGLPVPQRRFGTFGAQQ